MTKDVLVTVSGLQNTGDGEPEKIEVITNGSYYKKKNVHYLLYNEIVDNEHEVIKNMAKFDNDTFYISKSGYTNVNMSFEENKRNITNYITPYGNMLVGVDADTINVVEDEDNISVDIKYSLDINYEHYADCSLQLNITAKDNNERFKLQ